MENIYLEKVTSAEVGNGLTGEDYYESCMVEWIDSQYIKINNKVIDIYEGYDYRN
ncbi:hypothetical protein [Thomasclavelia cocleata]|uniref:hypothetical protein n=1 Tax=Thomasclavelia cocleata TaxID=69824 RepID=UPI00242D337D|nr:hypothetical protein [Thomasclavelia cocleata]MCI9131306.1 hypothetical protein [Thomasclavelia cocleata]MCI9630018.1 hypothetical protein [Thomasclavelia cocleata]